MSMFELQMSQYGFWFQIWNITSWPGEQLDRTSPNSNYSCQSVSNGIGPGVVSSSEIAIDCKFRIDIMLPPVYKKTFFQLSVRAIFKIFRFEACYIISGDKKSVAL